MRKKQFTSFDVAAVVRELHEAVLDSRVNNVYQLDRRTLLFKLRKADGLVTWLMLGAGKRLHLISYAVEKPKVPPTFCMALRKYLRNSWFTGIEQYEFERVVIFTFRTKVGVMRLFLELFGDGNIILVGENGKILHALSCKRMRDRNVLRGEIFHFPPPSGKNPLKVSKEELLETLRNLGDVEVVRTLARFLSIGGLYAEETLLRAGVDKKTPCNTLDDTMVDAVFNELQSLLSQVTDELLQPCVILDESERLIDVVPIKIRRYANYKFQSYESFNEALDEFYVRTGAIERAFAAAAGDVDELKREADRLKRIISSQEKVLVEAKAGEDENRGIGDAVYGHVRELQALLERFSTGKKSGKEWNEIVSEVSADKNAGVKYCVLFESFNDKRLVVNVCVDELCFGLSLRKSVFDNASLFYKRGKRAKRKLKGAKEAFGETCKKLEEVEAKIGEAETSGETRPAEVLKELAERKIRRKKWFEKFRWFVSSDGFLVVAGKDAVSNEVLVKKYTDDHDVVFHADVVGAPFVVVKTEGKQPNEQVLREAAEFAASFSRGWREDFASVDVYWVNPDQLSKSGSSGKYVTRGAFIVRGKRNWMRGVPLQLAVGVIRENGELRFVGGPVDAVKTQTNVYISIMPGDLKGKALFKHVLQMLTAKMPEELREKVLKQSVEKIRKYIPYNKGRILNG